MRKLYILLLLLCALTPFAFGQGKGLYKNKVITIECEPLNNLFYTLEESTFLLTNNAQVSYPVYFGELTEIQDIQAYYTAPGKKEKQLSKKAFAESSIYSSIFYSGWKKIMLNFPELPLGSELRWQVKSKTKELMLVAGTRFYDDELYLNYQYQVKMPESFKLSYDITPSVQDSIPCDFPSSFEHELKNGKDIYTLAFQQTDLSSCALPNFRTIVHPNDVDPYEYFNAWQKKLVTANSVLSQDAQQQLDQVIQDLADDESKIRAVFDFVLKRINYIAFENGLGAFQARNVNKILENKQGDCKDMSNLLSAALRYLGYDAYMGIIGTTGHTYDFDFPSVASANHAICILNFNNRWHFLDVTEKAGSFELPSRHIQGRKVFVINNQKGQLLDIDVVDKKNNKTITKGVFSIKDKKLIGQSESTFKGMSAYPFIHINNTYSKNEGSDIQYQYLEEQLGNWEVSNIEVQKNNNAFALTYDCKSSSQLHKIGDKYYLNKDFIPFPHALELNVVEEEYLLDHTTDNEFKLTLKFDNPVILKPIETIKIGKAGISYLLEISQPSATNILIVSRYTNDHISLIGDTLLQYNEINKQIKQALRKAIIYELE